MTSHYRSLQADLAAMCLQGGLDRSWSRSLVASGNDRCAADCRWTHMVPGSGIRSFPKIKNGTNRRYIIHISCHHNKEGRRCRLGVHKQVCSPFFCSVLVVYNLQDSVRAEFPARSFCLTFRLVPSLRLQTSSAAVTKRTLPSASRLLCNDIDIFP